MDVPVLGTQSDPSADSKWLVSVSWRYQRSFRHFVGSDEQEDREEDDSQVVNHLNLVELGIRYKVNQRWSVSGSLPFLMAERSNPIRDASGVVIDRSESQARGLSDVTCTARRWLLEPAQHKGGNVALGFGVKLPTGANNVVDQRTRFVGGTFVTTIESVDQSIQPGDGGFGAILDVQAFQRFGKGRYAFYSSLAYLFNPENTNGVKTFRSNPLEAEMSVADQYLARIGFSFAVPSKPALGFSLGGRLEGVPARDAIGNSDGFRRPGYAVSIEPAFTWSKKVHTFSVAVPWAIYRNRVRSVADQTGGGHGDAAFADWILLLGYWRSF